jgi:NAD(P)H-dependent FMN reductase
MPLRILAFAGSARRASLNRSLLSVTAALAREAGADVTEIDLADFPLPLYDGDLEAAAGLPEAARRLKALFREHDGLLLACPEYNSSITPLLKNTLDWCSRAESEDEPTLHAYTGKVAALVAASPGALGGLRGLRHVREILGNIGVHVIPAQHALGHAHQAFDANGNLTDPRAFQSLRKLVAQLIGTKVA